MGGPRQDGEMNSGRKVAAIGGVNQGEHAGATPVERDGTSPNRDKKRGRSWP